MIRNLLSLFLGGIRSPKPVTSPPLVSNRVNVFAGPFSSEAAATDYAMGLGNGGSLSADLGGAAIGPDDVEIIFGDDRIGAARPHLRFARPIASPPESNTYLLLSDRGYDTSALVPDRVIYLGLCDVT